MRLLVPVSCSTYFFFAHSSTLSPGFCVRFCSIISLSPLALYRPFDFGLLATLALTSALLFSLVLKSARVLGGPQLTLKGINLFLISKLNLQSQGL